MQRRPNADGLSPQAVKDEVARVDVFGDVDEVFDVRGHG
jgi:hypothetical protein